MISVIITSYKEPKTIKRAISCFLEQGIKEDFEVVVVCGDKETFNTARKYSKDYPVFVYQDLAQGKPAALNLGVKKAKGDILVLSDGDVEIGKGSLRYLLAPFNNRRIGAVSGHPIPKNSKKSLFGFWAYVLTGVAHNRRLTAVKKGKRFFCSGYFFAIRKNLFPVLKKELLSEDGFVSHIVYEKSYRLDYSSDAKVYVKYPTNFKDWIKQKKRSAGGYNQIRRIIGADIRSLKRETLGGFGLFRFVSNLRELLWLFLLFFARFYLWVLIYIDIELKNKSHKDIWVRVESTK